MAAGIELYNDVLNQKGSPALYSDTFANRPAFGYTGRLFISTDTNEIYRDTGTSWVLISSGGGGVNIYNSDGSLTAARTVTMANNSLTFEGGANVNRIIQSADNNVARILSWRTAGVQRWAIRVDGNETGSNAGADWALRSYNDAGTFIFAPISVRRRTGEIETFAEENITTGGQSIIGLYTNSTGTYAGGLTTTGGNPQSSNFNIYTLATAGNVTFANSNLVGTTVNVLRAQVQNAGTITFPSSASSALRAATNFVSQLQYNTSAAAGTFTHMANIHLQGVYEVSGGNLFTITNAYQLLLNSLNENGYTGAQLALTNRWGIYQDGASDLNYFAANTLLGTTTNTGERLQVAGTARVTQSAYLATASGLVGIGTTTPGALLDVVGTSPSLRVVGLSGTITQLALSCQTVVAWSMRVNQGGGSEFTIFQDATERIRITSAGNVGIGTTSPLAVANYTGVSISGTNGANVSLFVGATNTARFETNTGADVQLKSITALPLLLGTNNTERMRITSGGNVLIGTTIDAGQLLQVNGNSLFSSGVSVSFSGAGTSGISITPTNAAYTNSALFINTTSAASSAFRLIDGRTASVDTFIVRGDGCVNLGNSGWGTSATRTLAISTGTAPGTSPADCFQLYSADITAGNAAAHFRTEGGAVVKVYQETTGVAAATLVGGGGTTITASDTFDGYTLQQVVKALRNQGLLA